MRTQRRSVKTRLGLVLVATTALLAGLTTAMQSASATVIETGALQIHAAGSIYTGGGSFVSTIVAPGGVGTYSVLVTNTGSVAGQFNLRIAHTYINDPSTLIVKDGSVVITNQVTSSDGYFTVPIAPHKSATYAVTLTAPKTATIYDEYFTAISLRDTRRTEIDSVIAGQIIKSSTGTSADMFVTGSGQQPVGGISDFVDVTDPTLNVGGTATYSIKLINNTTTVTPMIFGIQDGSSCSSYFVPTVKVGSTVITASALAGTYQTANLKKGQSVAITVTVKFLSIPPNGSCYFPYSVYRVYAYGVNIGGTEAANLITNPSFGHAPTSFAPAGSDAVRISPVYTPEQPYEQGCPATFSCSTPVLAASDGSATMYISSGNAANPYTVTGYLGGPTNPCTYTAAAAANFNVSAPDADKQVTYTVFGSDADDAFAVSQDTGDHVCYESPNDFLAYYPNAGDWNHAQDCSCGDSANFGMVPIDPTTGDYLGLLANCSITSGQKPCLDGSGGTFNLAGPVSTHSYTATVDAPPGDPRITN